MSPQDRVRDRLPLRPDTDQCIGAAGHRAAVVEDRNRVYRALVQTQNLLGKIVASDQRIADASKLPESAIMPSAETASARIGPPCPRNCA